MFYLRDKFENLFFPAQTEMLLILVTVVRMSTITVKINGQNCILTAINAIFLFKSVKNVLSCPDNGPIIGLPSCSGNYST